MTQTAVIVVNFGPVDLLVGRLVDVARDLAPARVIVVDNYSTDAARAQVRHLCEREGWTGIYPRTNTGFGGGCNLGAQHATAVGSRYLLFLNPDATIDCGSLAHLQRVVTAMPTALAAPVLRRSDGSLCSAGIDLDLDRGEMQPWRRRASTQPPASTLPWVTGACFLIGVDLWERAGGFDDDYFLYWEDVDLCARVRAVSGTVVVVEEATAVHDEGQTHNAAGRRAKSPTYYYYNIRNRQLFAAKWLSLERQRAWRRTGPRAAYHILLRGGRRQFLRPAVPLRAVLRGLRDGARAARETPQSDVRRVRPDVPAA